VTLSPRIRRRLAGLADEPVNYDPAELDLNDPPSGWHVDDRQQALVSEAPGEPLTDGSFAVAQKLISGYKFADPSLVRAFYDPELPLAGRQMLLELRTLKLLRVYVGVRVGEVYEEERQVDGRPLHVFGWYYRTLRGHVEKGQMNWEVQKWLDSGEVAFHVHSVSRPSSDRNLIIRLGFRLLRGHERTLFLDSTSRRMREFTELGLDPDGSAQRIRQASPELTARQLSSSDDTHAELGDEVEHTELQRER
jgi:uncharacterized protein (UPF0548 family)